MKITVSDSKRGVYEKEVADNYFESTASELTSPDVERDAMLLDLDFRLTLIENNLTDLEV